jgi:hypothetical protein
MYGRVCGSEHRSVVTETGVDGNLTLIFGCRNLERKRERERERERGFRKNAFRNNKENSKYILHLG